jgi:hypothetical protein
MATEETAKKATECQLESSMHQKSKMNRSSIHGGDSSTAQPSNYPRRLLSE